jgi:hypothetical protein
MKDHSMTTSSKSTCELYRIWAAGHYAAISLDAWRNPDLKFGGELLVHSSAGDFGGTIASCDRPFKEQLAALDLASFLEHFGANVHSTFDGKASVAKLGKAILAQRRARVLSAELACELWGDLQFAGDTAARSELSFRITAARLCATAPILGQPADYAAQTVSAQTQFFWAELWSEFRSVLTRLIRDVQPLAA